jgi:hypothetical protein
MATISGQQGGGGSKGHSSRGYRTDQIRTDILLWIRKNSEGGGGSRGSTFTSLCGTAGTRTKDPCLRRGPEGKKEGKEYGH